MNFTFYGEEPNTKNEDNPETENEDSNNPEPPSLLKPALVVAGAIAALNLLS